MFKYFAGLAAVLCCSAAMAAAAFAEEAPATPQITPAAPMVPAAPASQSVEETKAPQASQVSDEGWQKLYEAWEALTPKQQADLYKAREAVDKADCAFIDKAAKYNLIEQELAEKMKSYIRDRTATMKQEGELPIFRRGMKKSA